MFNDKTKCPETLSNPNRNAECVNKFGVSGLAFYCTKYGQVCVKKEWDTRNKSDCCLGIKSSASECDPRWNQDSKQCLGEIGKFCGDQNSLGHNIGTDICQEYCINAGSDPQRHSNCDNSSSQFCQYIANNPNAPQRYKDYCACLNSTIKSSSACFDPKCTNRVSFQTENMRNIAQNCPAQCNIIIEGNLAGDNFSIDDNTFIQKCGDQVKQATGTDSLITWYSCINGQCVLTPEGQKGEHKNGSCDGKCTPDPDFNPNAGAEKIAVSSVIGVSILLLIIVLLFIFYRRR